MEEILENNETKITERVQLLSKFIQTASERKIKTERIQFLLGSKEIWEDIKYLLVKNQFFESKKQADSLCKCDCGCIFMLKHERHYNA